MSTKQICSIQFGLLTCDQIRRSGAAQITDTTLHQKDKRPNDFGLFSRYLGATQVHRCLTCGLGPRKCSGHFGYIELETWVYHPNFIDAVVDILDHVCYFCAASLDSVKGSSEYPICPTCALPNPLTWTKDHGLHIQPVWHSKTKFPNIQTKQEVQILFLPERALEILSNISATTYASLGYRALDVTHPKSYIINVIPVPSLASRSVVTRGRGAASSSRSLDDISALCQSILSNVNDLIESRRLIRRREEVGNNLALVRKEKLNKGRIDRAKYMVGKLPEDIQVKVAMLYNKDLRTMTCKSRKLFAKTGGPPANVPVHGPSRSTQQIASYSSLHDMITGNNKKQALVRGNLMGKRVEFTARTVITPDPTLNLNEIGVPMSICTNLTRKITVTSFNIEDMYAFVQTGPDTHPGATAVWKFNRRPGAAQSATPTTLDLENMANRERICLRNTTLAFRSKIRLRVGDIVERHLIRGDVGLFNRQPSLHRSSIMAHFVRPTMYNTFTFNENVCKSYNADFDGDEMNLHIPQTLDAIADAVNLLLVDHNICTPQTGFPVVSAIQDLIDVMFRLGTMDTFLTKRIMCDMLCALNLPNEDAPNNLPEPAIWVKGRHGQTFQPVWTGAQLASATMPSTLNLQTRKKIVLLARSDWDDPILDGSETHIVHGHFCSGWLTKHVVNKVTEVLFKTHGSTLCPKTKLSAAGKYLTRVSHLAFYYSQHAPSTIGIRDVSIQNSDLKHQIRQVTQAALDIISEHADTLREFELVQLCQRIVKYVGDLIVKSQPRNCSALNNLVRAVLSGARGSLINIVQIMGCLGQQHVEGQRIPTDGPEGRNLAFFQRNTSKSNLAASGLIAFSCFLTGLKPTEFIFHMMGGREGIISTAIKTALSGYITRRLTTVIKGYVHHGGFVVLGDWFLAKKYYADGLDASRLTLKALPQLFESSSKLIQKFYRVIPPYYLECLLGHHDAIAQINQRSICWLQNVPQAALFYDLTPHIVGVYGQQDVLDHVELELSSSSSPSSTMCDPWVELASLHTNLFQMCQNQAIIRPQQYADMLILGQELLTTTQLPPHSRYKRVLYTKKAWEWIADQCTRQAFRSIAVVGEQVGNSAAAAAGERSTQLTLDTFHNAGEANMIGAGGLQRLNEVLNVTDTSKMHHASMRIAMVHETRASDVVFTYLSQVMHSVALECATKHQVQDKKMCQIFQARHAISGVFSHFYPPVERLGVARSKRKRVKIDSRVYRIVLDKPECLRRHIKVDKISQNIFHYFVKHFKKSASRFSLQHSEPWMTTWVIRIRFIADLGVSDLDLQKVFSRSSFKRLHIGGCREISSACAGTSKQFQWIPQQHRLVSNNVPYVGTSGTNLRDVLKLPSVRPTHTWSNSIQETHQYLGIMAAQQVVFNEARAVLSCGGSYISPRHLYILAQTITHLGFVCPVSRHGLAKMHANPLLRMSFEEGRSVMEQASRNSSIDNCSDLTSCIILGKQSQIGSGGVRVLPVQKKQSVQGDGQTEKEQEQSDSQHQLFRLTTIQERKEQRLARLRQLETAAERKEDDHKTIKALQTYFGIYGAQEELADVWDDNGPDFRPASPSLAPQSPQYRPGEVEDENEDDYGYIPVDDEDEDDEDDEDGEPKSKEEGEFSDVDSIEEEEDVFSDESEEDDMWV